MGDAESVAGVDALLERLDDPDPRVRAVAAWALGEIKDPRAIEPLGRLLLDDHRIVRELAVLAIGEIEDPTALPVLRELGPEVASETVRAWAIAEILAGGEGRDLHTGELTNPGFGSADRARLVAELSDEDPRVRAVAAERLGRLGDPDAVEALLDAIADEDPTVRATAVWALDEINAARPPG
ncbi:MAG: HEAT repeat domain-containing protein [Gemmatimonadetes bacterium]|nr:HEAT repeat domain-containing protein [Gemmatimonadota bacterium]